MQRSLAQRRGPRTRASEVCVCGGHQVTALARGDARDMDMEGGREHVQAGEDERERRRWRTRMFVTCAVVQLLRG